MASRIMTYFKLVLITRIKQLLNALPVFSHTTYVPFLIMGHPRTGTSLLHTYLNAHLNILSLNEVLSEKQDSLLLKKPYSKLIKAIGFKYFYEYTVDPKKRTVLIDLLSLKELRVIKINRKNYLRTFVSLKIAEKTKEWSQTKDGVVSIKDRQLLLSKEDCMIAFNVYKKWEEETIALVNQSNVRVMEVDYDLLVANPQKYMNEVQIFLGASPRSLQSLLVKQNPEKLEALIQNYSSLKKEFEGTAYYNYFE